MTRSLQTMADRLLDLGVTRVVMEATPPWNAQDTVFVDLAWLQQRPPLQQSASEVTIDLEGQEPARFQRRQVARITYKGHRVPGILQNSGNRNHGFGVAGTPDKTEQDPRPTPSDALDNQATVMRALK